MRYYRVMWTDNQGLPAFSDPLTSWTSAELYRLEIGGDAAILQY
jgi:hypothetical protein